MRALDSQKKADWHKADIVAAIHKKGWSLRRLSVHYGLSAGVLKDALHRPYPNGERLIAAAIGVKPQEIWPSRYDADGQPNRGRKMRGFRREVTPRGINPST